MDDAFMTIGSIAIVLCAVFFLTRPFWERKLKHFLIRRKSPAAVAKILLKKDLSSKCARCTFYMNNDYDNEYSQNEWKNHFEESTKGLDQNSQEYAEAVAPFVNAIVVGDGKNIVRRGMEDLGNLIERFQPGINDDISMGYFIEPYEYVKDEKRAVLSEIEEQLRKKKREEEAPQRAARERCRNCVHERSCSWSVKEQTGACGGYTPKR